MAARWQQQSYSRADQSDHREKPPHRRVEECSIIDEIYLFGDILGEGSFGTVFEGTNRKSKEKYAIKRVNKEKAGKSSILLLEREVGILRRVYHPHIISLVEVIESPKKMYLIMELCLLGELKLVLTTRGPFSEVTTRHITTSLAAAIVYLHRNGIVHRDLKLENILVASERGDSINPIFDIKLTDFGLSVVKGAGNAMLQSTCGTPVYMAPEVIQNHDYTQQCDIWSIGVILYALLSNDFPFLADKEERLYEVIKKGVVNYNHEVWTNISDTAKNLIGQLLTVDPAYRLTASEIPCHPWMSGKKISANYQRQTNVLDMMKDFNSKNYDDDGDEEEEEDSAADESVDADNSNSVQQDVKSEKVFNHHLQPPTNHHLSVLNPKSKVTLLSKVRKNSRKSLGASLSTNSSESSVASTPQSVSAKVGISPLGGHSKNVPKLQVNNNSPALAASRSRNVVMTSSAPRVVTSSSPRVAATASPRVKSPVGLKQKRNKK